MMTTYLDYAATSPLLDVVKAKMLSVINAELGNASSLHSPGQRANALIEEARSYVAKLINADPSEIIFTSGGSESNNTVTNIFSGKSIAVSEIEHASLLDSAKARAGKINLIKVDERGRVDPNSLPDDADLVSVMLANNELGTIEPISTIARHVHSSSSPHPTYLHSDATQAFGKIPLDVKALDLDYLTISAHKIGGPTGIGALYVRHSAPFQPLIIGGHQEHKRRAGTSNTMAIAGFGEAAKWCLEYRSVEQYQNLRPLRDLLAERILAEVPFSRLNSPLDDSLPNILNVSFRAAEGESIQLYLDTAGITVSTGSACAAGDLQPSHVLMATTHDAERAHSSLRFSLGLGTTNQDIQRVMAILPSIIRRLQGISTIKITENDRKEVKNVQK